MASPVSDSYSAASGSVIAGGRFALLPTTALMGDSLTDSSYGLSTFQWVNGLNGGVLQLIANSGVGGDTVSGMLSRVDNSYLNGSPGLAGLGSLGYCVFRSGTNNARTGATIASLAATYTSLLNKIAGYAGRVIILAVPPLGGVEAGNNSKTVDYNDWLSSFAIANPTKFIFIDDCVNVRDGSNAQITGFFNADGIHFNGAGVMRCGIDAAAAASTVIGRYGSPLALTAEDIYPATPQWARNPTMIGTGGSASNGFTGQVVNNVTVSTYGGGFAGTCSIVAADIGDVNQTPWQRITPTSVPTPTSGESISITSSISGRTISGIDPAILDVAMELRLSALDTSRIGSIKCWIQGYTTAEYLTPDLSLRMGGGVTTQTVVIRQKMKRAGSSAQSGGTFYTYISPNGVFSGAMGSIDFRCATIRG